MRKIFGALVIKKFLVLWLAAALLVYERPSHAFVAPATNFVVNRAIASAVTKVAVNRGILVTDPRIAATLTGMGTVSTELNVASTAAGVGLAVAGAPVWMGIAAGLGVVAVGMGINAWINSPNGDVTQTQVMVTPTAAGNKLQINVPPQSMPSYVAPAMVDTSPRWAQAVIAGAPIYRSAENCYANEACYSLPLPPAVPSYRYNADWQGKTVLVTTDIQKFGQWFTFLNKPTLNLPPGANYTWEFSSAQTYPNSVGGSQLSVYVHEAMSGADDQGLPSYDRIMTYDNAAQMHGVIGPQYYPDLDQALPTLPTQVQTAKISTDTMARLVNAAWQRAAMLPDYNGLPYTYTEPVTEVELQPWAQEQPMSIPTIADLLTKASNPGTNVVPISPTVTPNTGTDPGPAPDPNPQPNPTPTSNNVNVVNTPNVNVTNTVKVDWGESPPAVWPTLNPPLIDLSIITQGLQPLKEFTVPSHSVECPKPSLNIFERTIIMDGHCALLDSVKPTLYAVMAAVWAILAGIIVLTA